MLDYIRCNGTFVAVPAGVICFDEITVRCEGRFSGKNYINSKQLRLETRSSADCGWKPPYLHTLVDNRSRNETGIFQSVRFASVLSSSRGAFNNNINCTILPEGSGYASWALQIAHATQVALRKEGRLVPAKQCFYAKCARKEDLATH